MFLRIAQWSFYCVLLALVPASYGQKRVPESHALQNRGAILFAENCAACHGSDGGGGERAPNIASQRNIVSLSDAQLAEIMRKGVPSAGMPAFGYLGAEKIHALVAHLRALQGITGAAKTPLPGNPNAGEAIFFGKSSCSECHMVHGRGGFIANDLTQYARGRSIKSIRAAIVDPDNTPGESGRLTTIRMLGGATYKGVVRSQDNFHVVLQSEGGTFHTLARKDIQQMNRSSHSLMPQDYGKTLTARQVDDLVSYLLKTADAAAPDLSQRRDHGAR